MAQTPVLSSHEIYNLDDDAAFKKCNIRLQQPTTDSFIVNFDSNNAKCAVDFDQDEALRWLDSENRKEGETLWLNFWASNSQRPIIEAVAKKYNLSPRLAGLLCPVGAAPKQQGEHNSRTSESSRSTTSGPKKSVRARTTDVEKDAPDPSTPQVLESEDLEGLAGMTFSKVVQSLWHFCSVDLGPRYIHIGFNGLYSLPEDKTKTTAEGTLTAADDNGSAWLKEEGNNSKPSGQRIWSSLIICDDGTVVSVFERPKRSDRAAHDATRRNILNVFRHLSKKHNQDSGRDALMKVRVRWYEQSKNVTTGYDRKEASSLLFYYLFDDWVSAFKLIARVEHPYREKLESLRLRMFDAAKVSLVWQVHDIGRQLTVLKHMYQSYELIVSRLIHTQRSTKDSRLAPLSPLHELGFRRSRDLAASQVAQFDDVLLDDDSASNVKLSPSAIVRFERLLDRIRLYGLTEIEECIKEKESLVLMVGDQVVPSLLHPLMPHRIST